MLAWGSIIHRGSAHKILVVMENLIGNLIADSYLWRRRTLTCRKAALQVQTSLGVSLVARGLPARGFPLPATPFVLASA
jgi:hypothetical protein